VCVRFRDQCSELRGDVCGVRAFEPDQESRVWLLRLPKFVGQETGCRSLPSRGHGARNLRWPPSAATRGWNAASIETVCNGLQGGSATCL
jgi:hypothetical protein